MSIKTKIRQYGIKNSFKRAVKALLRRIGIQYESFYLMVNHINPKELKNKMDQYDYSDVKELTYNDFKLGDPVVFNPSKLKLIKYRFESGKYLAYGIVENNQLIYSTWISKNDINFSTHYIYSIKLKKNEAVLEDSFCHQDYRGKGLHSKLNLYRLMKMVSLRVEIAYTVVVSTNTPALITQKKSGFQISKEISFLNFWGKQYTFEKQFNDRN